MAWFSDVLVGALTSGVNKPTYVLLNIISAATFASVLLWLVLSIHSNPALVPHLAFMLFLAGGLWISTNFFVNNIGLVDAQEQHEQLFGSNKEGESTEKKEDESAGKEPREDEHAASEDKKQQ